MSTTTSTTTSVPVAANASAPKQSEHVNAHQYGYAALYRIRTVKAARRGAEDSLHAMVAFNGGDAVDCKITGTAAKALFESNGLEALSQARDTSIEVYCQIGDMYSTVYQNKGVNVAGRKGRLLSVYELFINGESRYCEPDHHIYTETTMKASGYLRDARRYNKNGVPTDAVTIQFVHGKKGELNSDSHDLDVRDPELIDMLMPYVEMAQAINPDYDPTIKGSKKYAHSVWVSTTVTELSSRLYKGKDGKDHAARNGALKSISCIYVDGAVMYQAPKPEPKTEVVAQATTDVEAAADEPMLVADDAGF